MRIYAIGDVWARRPARPRTVADRMRIRGFTGRAPIHILIGDYIDRARFPRGTRSSDQLRSRA
jgi:hypothetical protein